MSQEYILLINGVLAAESCSLPTWLADLQLSPTELADLEPRGYPGQGYLRLIIDDLPVWDDITHEAVLGQPEIDIDAEVARQRWTVTERQDAAGRMKSAVEAEIQNRLDSWAQERQYRHCDALCSYSTSAHPTFGPEGRRGVEMRDAIWDAAYAIMADVASGARALPSMAEILAELPPLTWE